MPTAFHSTIGRNCVMERREGQLGCGLACGFAVCVGRNTLKVII